MAADEKQIRVAVVEKKVETAGKGCLVQTLGIAAPFVLGGVAGMMGAIVGVVLFLALLVVGSNMATVWRCGNCKNPVASRDVTVCPACQYGLYKPRGFWG